ncbi:putative ATP-dependent RNA helicase DDX31 [Babesia sp. Xinjiang]|uniref:putative ATP-dependent RNA helicase DDX31 n=1 Tax=Babesia sp. Xinjiang TaxID=462227 RepID=UPI000A239B96|nr:putative ATP-dependent RNA helicase DDX31 [Babesia sp. Xinjiang]ORM39498.1 putative ATP-dependent RNA helicase DDX31 [Babesia sp. Xinjiang]
MRLLQGHSRYTLALCRRLSQLYREKEDDDESVASTTDNYLAARVKVAARDTPSREDAVSRGDPSLFSGSFADLSGILSDRVIRSLNSCGYELTTIIQSLAIPKILEGCDVLIRSATGSGKTLTFLVPALQRLVNPPSGTKITRQDGTAVMIICPTRELSVQTKDTIAKLARPFPWIVVGAIKGGDSRKSEKAQIRKGITVLVGTPGRVLDHCESTSSFNVANIQMFVLDEADRLLDMGFEVKIRAIYKFLRRQRSENSNGRVQTVMTSATLTDAVQHLADFCLHNNRQTIGIEDDILSLPSTLTHEYVLVECKHKLICLISLLLNYVSNGEKVLIFVANCQTVVYLHRLLQTLTWPTIAGKKQGDMPLNDRAYKKLMKHSEAIDSYMLSHGDAAVAFRSVTEDRHRGPAVFGKVPILMLHGSMEANDRAGYVSDFMSHNAAILISTDVASRGLNLSKVNRVIQYDPPQQLEEYIHRSGRTARLGGTGHAMLILMQHEAQFINALRKRGVCVKQVMESLIWSYIEQTHVPKHLRTFKGYNVPFLRNCFSDIVASDPDLLSSAQAAFRASVQSYKTYSRELRRVFDFKKLHLGHYAASFCLKQRPSDILNDPRQVDIPAGSRKPGQPKAGRSVGGKRTRGGITPSSIGKSVNRAAKTKPRERKAPKPPRTPKAAALSGSTSQMVMKAVEFLKSRNHLLNK